jgi:outer membrane protein, heavy metal efflux system
VGTMHRRMGQGAGGLAWLMCLALLAGCQMPRTDVPAEAARATGIANGIAFQPQNEPIDLPEPAADGVLTLDDAVRRALAHDARIQVALAAVRVAEADSRQERLLPNPILNFSWRLPEGGGTAVFEATLTGDLIAILQKPDRISAADNRLRAACAGAIVAVLDVLSEVRESYAITQSTESQLGVMEERRQIVQRLLDLANARLKAGEGIRLDVITLEAQRSALSVETAQRRLELRQQRLTLARLIGEPSSPADWAIGKWEAPPAVRAAEVAWLRSALINRPEIRAQLWELAAYRDEVALTTLAALEGSDAGVHTERADLWETGPDITVPLPIFDWGQAKRAKAEAQRLEARHQLTQLQRQVVEEVRRAYAAYAESCATLKQATGELMPLQQKRREQAELAYRSGEADLTTLLLAEEELEDARAKLVELQEKAAVALVKLERAVGGAGIAATVEAAASTQPSSAAAATTNPSR